MEQHDDYVSGPHHYWFQFAGGFIFGAGIGAYVSSRFFVSGKRGASSQWRWRRDTVGAYGYYPTYSPKTIYRRATG